MNTNKMKNFVIITLVMTAVLQTGKLWLEDTDSHSFFYTIFDTFGKSGQQYFSEAIPIEPENIVTGFGNRKFSVFYPGDDFESFIQEGNNTLKVLIQRGKFVSKSTMNWEKYLAGKVLMYQYPFAVSSQEFMKGYKKSNSEISININTFDTIAILPGRSSSENLEVYFIHSDNNEASLFQVENCSEDVSLYKLLEDYQSTQNNRMMYISAKQSGFNIFQDNIFVPQWSESFLQYPTITSKNPFFGASDLSFDRLETAIEGFFGNYVPKWNTQENDIYIFSNESTVVKYYPDGVLEYYNYAVRNSDMEQTLYTAFGACTNFMKKDLSLTNEVYLADINFTPEGLVFYFDYTTGDFPVLLENTLQETISMEHAIEVVVNNNEVKKYKRYVTHIQISPQNDGALLVDFSQALDNAISQHQMEEPVTKIDSMKLVYLLSNQEKQKLSWKIAFHGQQYFYDGENQG